MSSKYSEFRKNKQIAQESSGNLPKDCRNQFNLEEIDQMMQALTVNIGLGGRQGPFSARRETRNDAGEYPWKQQPLKNWEMTETCDLTTNVDSQTISQLQIQKLPVISKHSSRRHHTEQQIESQKFDMAQETLNKSQFSLQSNECLLEDLEEKEEIPQPTIDDHQRNEVIIRLNSLAEKLRNKRISPTEATLLLQKLSKLEAFISQI